MSYLPYNLWHTNATINRIGGVLASVLASIAVNCWIVPRSGHTKDYKIGFGASSLSP
jgi:hypothetical protein